MSIAAIRPVRAAAALGLLLMLAACGQSPVGPGAAGLTPGAGLAGGVTGPGTGSVQEFTVTVGDRVFFETDSATLTSQAMLVLDRQAQWLQLYPHYLVTIEGHADERGTREYNIALAARRAAAVSDYLIARGVLATRISTISYGKERPVAVCDDITCWSQNRRAVTVIANP